MQMYLPGKIEMDDLVYTHVDLCLIIYSLDNILLMEWTVMVTIVSHCRLNKPNKFSVHIQVFQKISPN